MCSSHDTIQEVAGPPASTQKTIVNASEKTVILRQSAWDIDIVADASKWHIELYIYAIMHADSRSFGLTLIVH